MIRSRTEADLAALERALREVHEADGYPTVWPTDPLAFLAPPGTLGEWVAEGRGQVVGQVVLRPVPDRVPDWVGATRLPPREVLILSRLFVAPAARGRGLARALFRAAWGGARALNRPAVLDVHRKNLAAARLYEAEGWQRVATVNGDWLDPDGSVPRVHVYVAPFLNVPWPFSRPAGTTPWKAAPMPDQDDKNSGHTSLPGEYDRNGQEVHEREKGGKPSFKGANDREAGGARNTEHDGRKEQKDVEEARSVPATGQG